MKIRKLTKENQPKALALLRRSFAGSNSEVTLFEKLHNEKRELLEWICIHCNKAIAYIAFSNAYDGSEICGQHLALLAVNPEFQKKGVGAEILQFSLRQKELREEVIFVLGDPGFFTRFGFERCSNLKSSLESKKKPFLSFRNSITSSLCVGYEPEFSKKR